MEHSLGRNCVHNLVGADIVLVEQGLETVHLHDVEVVEVLGQVSGAQGGLR